MRIVAVASCAALLACGAGRHRAPPAPAGEGLALFQRFVPVLRHPRCQACHGGLDESGGASHPGAPIVLALGHQGVGCDACHDAASTSSVATTSAEGTPALRRESAWRLPFPEHAFGDKSDRGLCLQLREAFPGLPHDPSDLMQHIDHDERIRLAFEGRRGIREKALSAQGTSPPAPPPMTPAEFSSRVRDWAIRGHADCGVEP
jgi:hypothetical protein